MNPLIAYLIAGLLYVVLFAILGGASIFLFGVAVTVNLVIGGAVLCVIIAVVTRLFNPWGVNR